MAFAGYADCLRLSSELCGHSSSTDKKRRCIRGNKTELCLSSPIARGVWTKTHNSIISIFKTIGCQNIGNHEFIIVESKSFQKRIDSVLGCPFVCSPWPHESAVRGAHLGSNQNLYRSSSHGNPEASLWVSSSRRLGSRSY